MPHRPGSQRSQAPGLVAVIGLCVVTTGLLRPKPALAVVIGGCVLLLTAAATELWVRNRRHRDP